MDSIIIRVISLYYLALFITSFFWSFSTAKNYQTALQTSSSHSLESNVGQSPVQTETNINSTAFQAGQVFDQDNNTIKMQLSQNEDQFLHTPSTSFDTEQVETSTAVDGSLSQLINALKLQPSQNEDYQLSISPSFNTKQGEISTSNNNQELNCDPLMIESIKECPPVPEVRIGKVRLGKVGLG